MRKASPVRQAVRDGSSAEKLSDLQAKKKTPTGMPTAVAFGCAGMFKNGGQSVSVQLFEAGKGKEYSPNNPDKRRSVAFYFKMQIPLFIPGKKKYPFLFENTK